MLRLFSLLPVLFACASFASAEEPEQNRLRLESSAYLQNHADNPVDWYPWGPEALAKAKAENKPIFLSVGYASCHWCHVMERESFTDETIAVFLNENFVCVKVDREERPDVDAVYMAAVQIMSQNSGWPLNVFLTPEGEAFFGTSYLPPNDGDRGFNVGFLSLVKRIDQVWTEQEEQLRGAGSNVTRALKQVMGKPLLPPDLAEPEQILRTLDRQIAEEFDPRHGGFEFDEANAELPKFPQPSYLSYLLARHRRDADAPSEKMLRLTLQKMAAGGIHDQLGGGFHRYSVDRAWKIPHFEKMLYDNAQLLAIYAQASRQLDDPKFAAVARDVAEFLMAEMAGPEGQFYSAVDAVTKGEEGAYYRFTKAELEEILAGEDLPLAETALALGGEPNFESKYYVPQDLGAPEPEKVTAIKQKLLAAREKREKPFLDQKIITAWNGLTISGLAEAGSILEEPRYIEAAAKAADFLLANLKTEDGRLRRTSGTKEDEPTAYLDDYAFVIEGLLALHAATDEQRWLDEAVALQAKQQELFWDDDRGGYFFTPEDQSNLIVRGKLLTDGPIPSGNSVAISNLRRLAKLVAGDAEKYQTLAQQATEASAVLLNDNPNSMARLAETLLP